MYYEVILGLSVVMIVCVFLSNFFLSRVIKIEHDDFPAEWKKDGKPHAMPFWYPAKEKFDPYATNALAWGHQWLFKTPDWVKTNERASRMLKYFRFAFSGVFLVLFIVLATQFVTTPK